MLAMLSAVDYLSVYVMECRKPNRKLRVYKPSYTRYMVSVLPVFYLIRNGIDHSSYEVKNIPNDFLRLYRVDLSMFFRNNDYFFCKSWKTFS